MAVTAVKNQMKLSPLLCNPFLEEFKTSIEKFQACYNLVFIYLHIAHEISDVKSSYFVVSRCKVEARKISQNNCYCSESTTGLIYTI